MRKNEALPARLIRALARAAFIWRPDGKSGAPNPNQNLQGTDDATYHAVLEEQPAAATTDGQRLGLPVRQV